MAQEVTDLLEQVLDAPESPSILELEGLVHELWRDEDAAAHAARERDSRDG